MFHIIFIDFQYNGRQPSWILREILFAIWPLLSVLWRGFYSVSQFGANILSSAEDKAQNIQYGGRRMNLLLALK